MVSGGLLASTEAPVLPGAAPTDLRGEPAGQEGHGVDSRGWLGGPGKDNYTEQRYCRGPGSAGLPSQAGSQSQLFSLATALLGNKEAVRKICVFL